MRGVKRALWSVKRALQVCFSCLFLFFVVVLSLIVDYVCGVGVGGNRGGNGGGNVIKAEAERLKELCRFVFYLLVFVVVFPYC